ncbi:MAG: adenylosuccinate synthase [Dehalococcoidia bacterium]|jgi:adenylosuccinate synthase|nr:adenylosuccinate synthase [Chloroflexota bacterium]MDP6057154.1 adenylosuccinate synthase [Dehalococcoidia bacterium]MDP7485635.1 adenylosuccinate synthase [Dehalococcoidia bacterium]|tara:strand:+ start:502 stop:1779 length:1278 start_codon:yes stop_codon:yes gene_type:complete
MPAYAVIGAQWGDEGKGKIIDFLAENAAVIARYSGGNNAGHTVINDAGTFKLHLVPSGICWPHAMNVIGNGVVVDPDVLLKEINENDLDPSRLAVSDRAHLIMPYHISLDQLEEQRRGDAKIGTTGRGVGPAYIDKVSRQGLRVGELLDPEDLTLRLPAIVAFKNEIITKIYGGDPIELNAVFEKANMWAGQLAPYIRPVENLIADALESDGKVIVEGAQGALLDLDHGTYPYVTSSNPTVGGTLTGLGMGPRSYGGVAGVFKAYCTRVGEGPFPSEIHGEEGDSIREQAGEFGTTTGRARRIGWFDAVAGRYSARVNGFDAMIITKLDILDGWEEVNICVAYEIDGVRTEQFPVDAVTLDRAKPIYETHPGWTESTRSITKNSELNDGARAYIHRLEELIGVPTKILSTGPRREETLVIEDFLA